MKTVSAVAALIAAINAADGAAVTEAQASRRGLFSKLRERRAQPSDSADDDDVDADTVAQAPAAPAVTAAPSVAEDAVPPPSEIGPDGFPSLPAISSMASGTSKTMKDLNSQASILEARIAQMQMENEAKLARQKAIFETKLKTQETGNRQVVNQNQLISAQIAVLKQQNGNLTKQADDLADDNKLGRVELQTMQTKLKAATKFIDESLKATNEHGSKALEVLQVADREASAALQKKKARGIKDTDVEKEEDHQQQDDQADDGEEEEVVEEDVAGEAGDADGEEEDAAPATSFLGLRSKVHRMKVKEMEGVGALSEIEQEMFSKPENPQDKEAQLAASPQDLLKVLSSQVEGLSKGEQTNGAKLKDMFLSAFKAGTKRHNALLKQQKKLNTTRAELTTEQGKLQSAVAHLENTHEHMQERLRGLGLFMQRLGHLAIAPSSEAKHLLKNLPNKISPAKPKEH